jgi:hypothetical protein
MMSRCSFIPLLRVAFLSLAIGLVLPPASSNPLSVAARSIHGQRNALSDPFPIHRVLQSPEQVGKTMADAGRDRFLRMPRADFEGKVQAAALRQTADRLPPQIVEAVYRAQWTPGRLSGFGKWGIRNPSGLPGPVSLEPLTPAIDRARWSDGRLATVFRGPLSNRAGSGNLLWNASESGGEIEFEWSLRGLEEADEERYDLALPIAPIAHIELTLPQERTPLLPSGQGTVQGPFPASSAGSRTWKIFPGRSGHLELAVRKGPIPGNALPAIVSRSARWWLTSTVRTGIVEIGIDGSRGIAEEHKFALDSNLVVHDVSGVGVKSWKLEGAELGVRIGDLPGPAKLVFSVSAIGAVGANGWVCPSLQPKEGITGTDAIEIHCARDIKIEGWTPGDYRISATSRDHATLLAFTGTFPASAPEDREFRRMPSLRYRSLEGEYTTSETLEWRIEPGRSMATSDMELTIVRGPLATIGIQLLGGFVPTSVTSIPDDAGLIWSPAPGLPNTWIIEPTRAMAGGSKIRFRVEARGTVSPQPGNPGDASPRSHVLPFPVIRPLGASDRQLKFSASSRDDVEIRFRTSTPGARFGDRTFQAEYGKRDAEGEAIASVRSPTLTLGQSNTLTEESDRSIGVASTYQGTLDGSPASGVMLAIPGHEKPSLILDGNPVQARLASLPGNGDQSLAPPVLPNLGHALAAVWNESHPYTRWFVPFPRPTVGGFSLTVSYRVDPPTGIAPIRIPLANIVGGTTTDTRTKLDAGIAERYKIADSSNDEAFLIPLDRSTNPIGLQNGRTWKVSELRCTNTLDDDGTIRGILTGSVSETGGPYLDIHFGESRIILESARVGSHEVSPPGGREDGLVRLPIASAGSTFELRYRLRQERGLLPVLRLRPVDFRIPGADPINTEWRSDGSYLIGPLLRTGSAQGSSGSQWAFGASLLRAAGYSSAVLCLAVGWIGWPKPWSRGRMLALFSVLLFLGCVTRCESPGWSLVVRPILLVCLLTFALGLFRTGVARWPTAAAGLFAWTTLHAQPTETEIVFLVPASEGRPETLYAPKALMAKLDAMAKSPLPPALVTRTEYTLQPGDDAAVVDAVCDIESATPNEQTLEIPFGGIRIERALLDGAPAFLDGSKGDRYSITLAKAGRQSLQLRFSVPVTAAGSIREVRFGVPDIPCCKVGVVVGKRVRQVDVSTRRGGQAATHDGSNTLVEADHGGGKLVQIRWRDDTASEGTKPSVAVKEAALWDFQESETVCTSAFLYRIQGGTLSELKLEYPDNLVPVRVDLRTLDARPAPPGLKGWTFGKATAGWSPMTIRLQNPSDGRIALVAKFRPKNPLTAKPTLRNPRSSGVADGDRESFFGLRLQGLQLDGLVAPSSFEIPSETLLKDFAAVPELNFERLPVKLYRRSGAADPQWKPALSVPAPVNPEALEISYFLGRRIEAVGRCRAKIRDGGIVEFEIPSGFRISEIDGPHLAGWWRNGNRVTSWFHSGVPSGLVEIAYHGSIGADPSPPEGGIDLPLPRWPVGWNSPQPVEVEVRGCEGYRAAPLAANGLRRIEEFPPFPDRWNYTAPTTAGLPKLRFSVVPDEASQGSQTLPLPRANPPANIPPAATLAVPTPTEARRTSIQAGSIRWIPWIGAGAWVLGLCLVLRWPARRWPERIIFLGLLGAAALGFTSLLGMAMLGLAAFGVAGRVWKLLT